MIFDFLYIFLIQVVILLNIFSVFFYIIYPKRIFYKFIQIKYLVNILFNIYYY